VTLLLLIRHGLTDATGNRLYGTSPGVHLSGEGREQAELLADRLSPIRLGAVYSSPLERCIETAEAITKGRGLEVEVLPDLEEVEYGEWTGRSFKAVRRTELWRRLHDIPSSVRFPGGQTLGEVRERGVRAVELIASRNPRKTIAAVSHGDVIRLILAHYAGIHIDLFHRLQVDPGSVSAVTLGDGPPRIVRLNETGTLSDLVVPRRQRRSTPRVRG
jgi:probable phosphomutase (TIGR03848 family)